MWTPPAANPTATTGELVLRVRKRVRVRVRVRMRVRVRVKAHPKNKAPPPHTPHNPTNNRLLHSDAPRGTILVAYSY